MLSHFGKGEGGGGSGHKTTTNQPYKRPTLLTHRHHSKYQVVKVSPGGSSRSLSRPLSHSLSRPLSHIGWWFGLQVVGTLKPSINSSRPVSLPVSLPVLLLVLPPVTLNVSSPVSPPSCSLSHSLSHSLSCSPHPMLPHGGGDLKL